MFVVVEWFLVLQTLIVILKYKSFWYHHSSFKKCVAKKNVKLQQRKINTQVSKSGTTFRFIKIYVI